MYNPSGSSPSASRPATGAPAPWTGAAGPPPRSSTTTAGRLGWLVLRTLLVRISNDPQTTLEPGECHDHDNQATRARRRVDTVVATGGACLCGRQPRPRSHPPAGTTPLHAPRRSG